MDKNGPVGNAEPALSAATGPPATGPAERVSGQPGPAERDRVEWLDGVRACAALYVLMHHTWLAVYPSYPRITGPWLLGWLIYGHLGVVVFIVVSGYSLSLAPARGGYRLKNGIRGFARRRFWRIVPPYWAALIISTILANVFIAARGGEDVTVKAVVVHALLLQDIIGSPTMNGAFWSIAVEAQIYLLFPLLLWWSRRWGVGSAAGVASVLVVIGYLLAEHVHGFARINNFTPQLLIGFVFGMFVAGRRSAPRVAGRPVPLLPLAAVAGLVLLVVFNRMGSVSVITQYFWGDIAVAAVAAITFWGLSARPTARLRRGLSTRPFAVVGAFSYSIYLVHAPLVSVAYLFVVKPRQLSSGASFALMLGVVAPIIVGLAFVFYRLFEQPFLTIRSLPALKAHIVAFGRRSPVHEPIVGTATGPHAVTQMPQMEPVESPPMSGL